jgi:CrcB protein
MNPFVIALGGAIGSLLRYWLNELFYLLGMRNFPYGILSINVLGSLFMGFFSVYLVQKFGPSHLIYRSAVMVGLLGGFTTFSSFSLDVVSYFQQGYVLKACIYILLSLVLCFSATLLGIFIASKLSYV